MSALQYYTIIKAFQLEYVIVYYLSLSNLYVDFYDHDCSNVLNYLFNS